MNDLFYRKDKRKLELRVLGRRLLKNKRLLAGLILGLPLLIFILFGNHGVVQRLRLQHQRADLETKIQQAEEEGKRLQSESKALDGDKRAIEKVARENYGMHREGETVYKVAKRK
jgi:cell division protein FtsB